MRRLEWTLGLLSAVLALAAIVFTATQHTFQMTTGSVVVYGPGTRGDASIISSPLACCLVVVASLLVALGAAQDARRMAAGQARGGWRWLVMVGAALSIVGVFLLSLSGLWVVFGGSASAPAAGSQISAALLFTPAALAAIMCAVIAALPRGGHQRQAHALA